jgi:hypothetical protein
MFLYSVFSSFEFHWEDFDGELVPWEKIHVKNKKLIVPKHYTNLMAAVYRISSNLVLL